MSTQVLGDKLGTFHGYKQRQRQDPKSSKHIFYMSLHELSTLHSFKGSRGSGLRDISPIPESFIDSKLYSPPTRSEAVPNRFYLM